MTTTVDPHPRSFLKYMAPVAVILALVLAVLFFLQSRLENTGESHAVAPIAAGSTLPDFQLYAINKAPVPISSIQSKVILVNFWASWCEACMSEMPSLVNLWGQYKDKGFQVVSVNVDENPELVMPRVAHDLHMRFPLFVDRGQKLSDLFDVHAIPLSVIMDSHRKILYIETGERDWTDPAVKQQLEKWLSG